MAIRNIVEIDEAKCNGCGLCVKGCAEGAIQIVDGKAKLVSDVYCDGLGACLGECPEGAISIVQREAADFDEAAVEARQQAAQPAPAKHQGCPGTRAMSFAPAQPAKPLAVGTAVSQLGNWPVQLTLASPQAPCFQDASILLVADCVPVAYPSFHQDLLRGQPVIIACPKLDDARAHAAKLADIIATAAPRDITVVHMEVPCCMGLVRIAQVAIAMAGADIPLHTVTIGIRGQLLADTRQAPAVS